jgi:hypothetical protein
MRSCTPLDARFCFLHPFMPIPASIQERVETFGRNLDSYLNPESNGFVALSIGARLFFEV